MYNFGPYDLKLEPSKLTICQLIFERAGEIPLSEAKTKFLGQKDPDG